MNEQRPASQITIRPEPEGSSLVVYHVQRTLVMHWLTESEIDDLTAPTVGLYLTFFGLALGAAISFGITLATVGPMSPKTYATFVALFGISLGGVVLFGAKSWMDYRRARRRVAELKQGRRTRRLASDHA